jgi:hypothetical protein
MLAPDGKNRLTDVADMSQLFRLIQSIPSKKAEPFKNWMAEVAAKRIDQMQDPELNYEQGYEDYQILSLVAGVARRLGSINNTKVLRKKACVIT